MTRTLRKPIKKNNRTRGVVEELDRRVDDLLAEIQQSEVYSLITNSNTDPSLVKLIMAEVYQEIVWYQPTVIEKTIAVIGQMPRSLPAKTIRAMLVHQSEEFDHGEMALRDLLGLGGSEALARTSPMSPEAHAVAAFWCMLENQRKPSAYLGALYLFEGLTPLVTTLVKKPLKSKGLPDSTMEFIEFHSTEDIKHQNMVRSLICKVADLLPAAETEILQGCDWFRHVYPMPVWAGALERAKAKYAENNLEPN